MDTFNSVMLALSLTVSITAAVCMLRRPAGAVPMGRQSKNWVKAKVRALGVPCSQWGSGQPIIWPMLI